MLVSYSIPSLQLMRSPSSPQVHVHVHFQLAVLVSSRTVGDAAVLSRESNVDNSVNFSVGTAIIAPT